MREGINRVNVKKCEDLVMKMEIEKEEKGSENIVREIEEKDILKLRKQKGNRIVVLKERRDIEFEDIGKNKEKMMEEKE